MMRFCLLRWEKFYGNDCTMIENRVLCVRQSDIGVGIVLIVMV